MSRQRRDVRDGGGINHRRNVRLWRTGRYLMSRTMRDVRDGGGINHRRNVRILRTGRYLMSRTMRDLRMTAVPTTGVTCAFGARDKLDVAHDNCF
ncbi:hypothetical protein [Idiomarina sp.]|uniref:hypothetical protein n=1 Tax=Idiomarina sp. TaxID=1874361 RepID=UPI0035139ED4